MSSTKRHHNMVDEQVSPPALIPGLPDHISQLILTKLPPSLLYKISSTWRRLIYTPHPHFPPHLSLYTLLSPLSPLPTPIHFSSYDPVSSNWVPLPSPPLSLLSRHPSFISRYLPIQSLTVNNHHLAVVAATSLHLLPALPQPLLFNPLTSTWHFAPPLPVPRRWCAAASINSSIYIASGVGSHFSISTARSVLKLDLNRVGLGWDNANPLPHGKFSREAADAVGWRGKLCVVHVVAKEGAIYNPENDTWIEMKQGMVGGWRGPVAVMDNEDDDDDEIYVVDEVKGFLRKYDDVRDCWVDVLEDKRFRGAQQMAARSGKVCVVSNTGGIVVVDVVVKPIRTWVVEPPVGFKPVAIHILPRMSQPL